MIKVLTAASVVLLLCCLSAAQAQPVRPGTPAPLPAAANGAIASILVEGNSRVEPDSIRSYLAIKEGDAFDPEKIDQSLKTLFATGLFADVNLRRDGNNLVVKVIENPIINRIAFEGNRKLEDDALRQEIQSKPRVVFTRAKVQADVKRILELYRRSGRFNATVEPKIIQLEQNRVDLVFEISEGATTGIRAITFVGNEEYSDGSLREVIRTKESAWYRFLSSDDRYDPDRVNFDRELLRKFYLSEGYADFRVASAVAELTPDRNDFFVTFTINEGDRYRFGKIDVTSRFEKLDVGPLKSMVTLREGDWYDADQVDKTINLLTEAVGNFGYAFVDIRPNVKRNKDTKTIDLTFEIQEGPRVYVERINISGNTRTLDKVIRREFRLVEGDAFNAAKLRRSQQRLNNLGFFEKVDIANQPGSAPDKTVIEVSVVEQSTGELSFGAGYSTAGGLLGDVSIRERNLLGRGQDLRLGLSLGTQQTQINLSFTEPYFLDRNVAAGFDVFRISTDRQSESSYSQKSLGFALRTGFNLGEDLRQNLKYTLRSDEVSQVPSNASAFIKKQEGKTWTSEIGTQLMYDKRDNRQFATAGYFLRYAIDVGGLGGTEHYVRNKLDGAYFYSIADQWVLSVSGEFGVVVPIKDDLRINNRWFVGGDNLRGFAIGGIGPRDTTSNDSLGGKYYGVGSVELSFPLGLPQEFGLLGKAFADAGTLWGTDEKSIAPTPAVPPGPGGIPPGIPGTPGSTVVDNKALRASIGLGLQWISPFGPIRVDYAIPILKKPYDQVQNFRFSFGTRF
ncbi:MAG: outer membrane protein assembly factor BamA [Rhodospirillales bacterium]